MPPEDIEKKDFAEKILAKLKEDREIKKKKGKEQIIEGYIELYENLHDSK